MQTSRFNALILVLSTLTLTACGQGMQAARSIAQHSLDHVGCKLAHSEMWNALHSVAESGGDYPSSSELRQVLLNVGAEKGFSGRDFETYVDAFVNNYDVTIGGIEERFAPHDLSTWKKALAEMEIGVKVTEAHAELSAKVEQSLAELTKAEKSLNAVCPVTDPELPPATPTTAPTPSTASFATVWEQLKAEANPEIYGSNLTIATIYQSCDVLKLAPMNGSTPSVEGIRIRPDRHPAGGARREYDSVSRINATHYYIKDQRLAKASCLNIHNSPPIYDFGGKPYTSSSNPRLLDLFKDAGSGTGVTGIDCSAFVFSSLALAGLKMDPDPAKPLKADLVHGIGSRAFKDPQNNGLRCLSKIKVTADRSLDDGDVVAISGHVVMLEDVARDPFGINRARNIGDCTATVLTSSGYDFTIAQSSPSKGGIGINRYRAKDYLAGSKTFRDGFARYAMAACKARFGGSAVIDSPNLSVVRHKKTPECMAEPLTTTHADCVDVCKPL